MLGHPVTSDSLATPATVFHQAPLSMGFPWQEYWSRLPFPPPRDLPNPGIKPVSLLSTALAGRFFTTEPPEKPLIKYFLIKVCTFYLFFFFFSNSAMAHLIDYSVL